MQRAFKDAHLWSGTDKHAHGLEGNSDGPVREENLEKGDKTTKGATKQIDRHETEAPTLI